MSQSRRRSLAVALAGLALLVVCGALAHGGRVGAAERRVFHWINDLPQWMYRFFWVCQQFGNLAVAFALAVAIAVALRKPRVAGAAGAAVLLKLVGERIVKKVVKRQRPGRTIGNVVLRGNVPAHGLSFVSGHAVITAAIATILTPLLPGRWKAVPWVVVVLNGVARVYVGAHNPLDILGGVGLGLAIGGIINAVMPSPTRVPSGVAATA